MSTIGAVAAPAASGIGRFARARAFGVQDAADELADFHAALTQASEQYRIAMDDAGIAEPRPKPAAAVHAACREILAWQSSDQFGKNRPAPFVGATEQYRHTCSCRSTPA